MMATVDMGTITWSDHALFFLTLMERRVPTRICHWRLNESLLKKPTYREELRKHIVDYFEINEGSVSSSSLLWDAHKAVICGHCISLSARIKKNVAALYICDSNPRELYW